MTVAAAAFALNASVTVARPAARLRRCGARCTVAYGAFWFAIIGYVASSNRSGESNIVRLLLCWAGFTLIVPAAVTAIAEAIYPPPSRLAYLAEARRIEIETERREGGIASGFFIDHPELVVDDASEMPAYLRTAFFVTSTVDNATRPVLDAFERTAARRDDALALLRYVSPAIIAHGVFNEAAGSFVGTASQLHGAGARVQGCLCEAGRSVHRRRPAHAVGSRDGLPALQLPGPADSAQSLPAQLPALVFLAWLAAALMLSDTDRRLRRLQ